MRCKSVQLLVVALAAVAFVACGGGGDSSGGAEGDGADAGGSRPVVVVSTAILGDVVTNLVGERAEVQVVMPPGASPHEFQASARQVAALREADALVVNGAGFEEGLEDAIEAAREDGVATFEAISAVDTLDRADGHAASGAAHAGDREGDQEGDHGEEGVDPHFFTDPRRTEAAARGIVDFLAAEVPALGGDESAAAALRASADPYLAELARVDREAEQALALVPAGRRTLVTNHEVFGYFADRYGFEVLGAIIPGGGTQATPSPAELDELARLVRRAQVKAVFADTSSPEQLATALATEVGDVEVVELYSESLGPPGSDGATYLDLVRTNVGRIAAALAG